MTRLIDADEMLKRLESWNTDDEMDKALYNFTLSRIIEQPTVDAVPVSWILDQWLNNYYDMPEPAKIVIRTMIKKWREENANHD